MNIFITLLLSAFITFFNTFAMEKESRQEKKSDGQYYRETLVKALDVRLKSVVNNSNFPVKISYLNLMGFGHTIEIPANVHNGESELSAYGASNFMPMTFLRISTHTTTYKLAIARDVSFNGHPLIKFVILSDTKDDSKNCRMFLFAKSFVHLMINADGTVDISSECPVCMSEKTTVLIPCGHGLCSQCFPNFLKSNETKIVENQELACPVCRTSIINEYSNFLTDFASAFENNQLSEENCTFLGGLFGLLK